MNAMKHIRTKVFETSQEGFATICEVSQATVSRWESDDLLPGLAEMRKIRRSALSRDLKWNDSLFFASDFDLQIDEPAGLEVAQ